MATVNTVTAVDIASYIEQNKNTYGHMQLQKLVYYCQAWSLAWTGKTLFAEEIEAWKDGPVVRDVYDAVHTGEVKTRETKIPHEVIAIVEAVWNYYGQNTGKFLSKKSHEETPWIEARGDLPAGAGSTNPLSQTTMRRYYSRMAMTNRDKAPKLPAIGKDASSEEVRITAQLQCTRWASVLDALASR